MTTIPIRTLQPDVDIDQASQHLELLHGQAAGFASLVLLGNDRRERHCFFAVGELRDASDVASSSRDALQDVVDARWNVYTACSTFTSVPERGRGTRTDILSVPGVWADLDVKPDTEGYFATEDQVRDYIGRLPQPSLEIASGSGGRHVYWLTHDRLNAAEGQELLTWWLDFLRSEANGAIIENVHDTTRILRLAGTVRWPKMNDVMAMPRPVELLRIGPRYHVDELRLLARAAHLEQATCRDELRAHRVLAEQYRMFELQSRGLQPENYERVVRMFNLQQDWAGLLEPTGWTLHSDQRDGAARCRFWTRPGKRLEDGKSASTDFTAEDGTISRLLTLYSNDPALQDLRDDADDDAVGIVSKWTYALKRLFDGDEVSLLRSVVAHNGSLS